MPYVPYPTEKPSGGATPGLRISAIPAAFGANIGQAAEGYAQGANRLGSALQGYGSALKDLGQIEDKVGNELWNRAIALQELRNETEAREADAKYMMDAGKLHADYGALQGKAAVDGFPKYTEDLQNLRKGIRDGLSNDMARKLYDSSSLSTMGRTIFNGAGHAATQNKQWSYGASVAREDATKNNIFQNPTDEVTFKRGTDQIRREKLQQGEIKGWGQDQLDNETTKAVSSTWRQRITGLSKTAPFSAEKMLDENRDQLDAADVEPTENAVRQQVRTVGARNISSEETADLFGPKGPKDEERSLEERIEVGMRKAREMAPKDELFPDYVRDRIIADYNRAKAVKRDTDFGNKNVIDGALMGGKDGKIPTTVEELKANPRVAQAWDDLDESNQRKYLKDLARNAKGDVTWSDSNLKTYQQMKGLSHNDPSEFLNTDVTGLNLPFSARKELINLQERIKSNPGGDPRIGKYMQGLKSYLDSAGIDTKHKEEYNQFTGAFSDAIHDFEEANKKAPKPEEAQAIAFRLLQEQVTAKGFIFDTKEKVFEMKVPSEVAEKIKTDPKWKEIGIEPTDEQIRRVYVRMRYKELYPGKAKSPDKVPD